MLLKSDRFIIVLSDGETFSDIEGATLKGVPHYFNTEDTEEALSLGSLDSLDLAEVPCILKAAHAARRALQLFREGERGGYAFGCASNALDQLNIALAGVPDSKGV